MVTLALCQAMLSMPNALHGVTEYDDGVYLGAALRLVRGVIPYRDFVFLHPPGIIVLMAPLALLARWAGSPAALSMARETTVLISAGNSVLAGLALRHRGRRAVLTAGFAMALYPLAPDAEHTLLLEPYLVFFCLLGVCALFSGGSPVTGRRLVWAGICIGFAIDVKIWAGVIAVVALCTVAGTVRRAVTLSLGTAIGCTVPLIPFLVAAPGPLFHDVVVAQVGRTGGPNATPLVGRLATVSGLTAVEPVARHPAAMVVIIAIAVAIAGAAILIGWQGLRTADRFFLAAAASTVGMMFLPETVYPHYGYFSAAFLALVAGTVADLFTAIVEPPRRRWVRHLGAGLTAFALVWFAGQQVGYGRVVLATSTPARPLGRLIPPGACVVGDTPADLEASGVFFTRSACPPMVDPYGTVLADSASDPSEPAGPGPTAFVADWSEWLSSADFMVEHGEFSAMVPWTPGLKAWFATDYRLVGQWSDLRVYRHVVRTRPLTVPETPGGGP